jgi:hypothetical protein
MKYIIVNKKKGNYGDAYNNPLSLDDLLELEGGLETPNGETVDQIYFTGTTSKTLHLVLSNGNTLTADFQDISGGAKVTNIYFTGTDTKVLNLEMSDGSKLTAPFQDISGGGASIEGTINVTSSITLSPTHNQKTLICKNTSDITITVPTGLGTDFTCNFVAEEIGNKIVEIVQGTGVTLKAPHGKKLLTDYTCNIIKKTGLEQFNLQGELTP